MRTHFKGKVHTVVPNFLKMRRHFKGKVSTVVPKCKTKMRTQFKGKVRFAQWFQNVKKMRTQFKGKVLSNIMN